MGLGRHPRGLAATTWSECGYKYFLFFFYIKFAASEQSFEFIDRLLRYFIYYSFWEQGPISFLFLSWWSTKDPVVSMYMYDMIDRYEGVDWLFFWSKTGCILQRAMRN